MIQWVLKARISLKNVLITGQIHLSENLSQGYICCEEKNTIELISCDVYFLNKELSIGTKISNLGILSVVIVLGFIEMCHGL